MRLPVLVALLTFALGLPFAGMTGMHMDASLELACLYPCSRPAWATQILGKTVPWMVMTYLGSIKAWLFAPLLAVFPATVWTLRLPLLATAAVSAGLFAVLLRRLFGTRVAISGGLLLAVDASYVLAGSIDFGPVVGLHVLWLAGVLLLLRFEERGRLGILALAFFCFGLALWHKALFLWMLGGLGVAGLASFPRRILRQVTAKRVGVAAAAMLVGCLPLVVYNIRFPLRTFRIGDVAGESSPISHKLVILRRTLDGSVLQGFLNEEAWVETHQAPRTAAAKTSVALANTFGAIHSNTVPWFALATLLLTPWLLTTGSRQAVLFCWTYLAVVWAQMALVGKTGGSIHHVLLLWPVPQMLLVLAGREVARQWRLGIWVAVAALALMVTGNLLLLNQYFADLATKGTGPVFTDAVEPLRAQLEAGDAEQILAVDWGYQATLCLQSKGRLPVEAVDFSDQEQLRRWIRQPATVFVAHSPQMELVPGIHDRLRAAARDLGWERQVTSSIRDGNGRPRFELWRFEPLDAGVLPDRLAMGNPQHAPLLRGLWEIEAGQWRWSGPRFSFRLAPVRRAGTQVELDVHLPEVILQRLGPVTVTGRAGRERLVGRRLAEAGDHLLRWPVGAGEGASLDVAFTLDKALAPVGEETRELGLIVRGVGLVSR
ncbi:MAG: glycosyltransferase family 39 protein [Bryobacterales bacterium]|nr:glycosyltransferase family 39 protein [Bryobacterales bacterium]